MLLIIFFLSMTMLPTQTNFLEFRGVAPFFTQCEWEQKEHVISNSDYLKISVFSLLNCSSPDLYVKLYVVNVSTQKRVIKKKTRVCRHDREPSFNETFRFSLSPAGHSLQVTCILLKPEFICFSCWSMGTWDKSSSLVVYQKEKITK